MRKNLVISFLIIIFISITALLASFAFIDGYRSTKLEYKAEKSRTVSHTNTGSIPLQPYRWSSGPKATQHIPSENIDQYIYDTTPRKVNEPYMPKKKKN